ncbi:family 11 glycoside hydrolase, partial [Piromyces sp. E2]
REIDGMKYELWYDGGNNGIYLYNDGSFSCTFTNAKDYYCRKGLSFDSTKTHQEIGHIYADFNIEKRKYEEIDFSYIGAHGWSRDPLIEFFVVDDWFKYRPGDWVGNKKYGNFTIDGAVYDVYENTRYGPSIEGNISFKQYFSIRKESRKCGRIDITAHFEQWEKLGMKLGRINDVKLSVVVGSNISRAVGEVDFVYAKVGVEGNNSDPMVDTPTSCPSKILDLGYPCCSYSNCVGFYSDEYGDWSVENGDWCNCRSRNTSETDSSCPPKILEQGFKCCSNTNCEILFVDDYGEWSIEKQEWCICSNNNAITTTATDTSTTITTSIVSIETTENKNPFKSDFCWNNDHTGKSVKVTSDNAGHFDGVDYGLSIDRGEGEANFFEDGSFICSFNKTYDIICGSGLDFDGLSTYKQLGNLYGEFSFSSKDVMNEDYSFVGVHGWSREPLVEFLIVDNWLGQWGPGKWPGDKNYGKFIIDGAEYTVFEYNYTGKSIDGIAPLKRFFSVRNERRECGTINITAHFEQWDKLGMKFGKLNDVKVFTEAGCVSHGASGVVDFTHAKVYI